MDELTPPHQGEINSHAVKYLPLDNPESGLAGIPNGDNPLSLFEQRESADEAALAEAWVEYRDTPLSLSFGASARGNAKTVAYSAEQFFKKLLVPHSRRTDKDGPFFAPASLIDDSPTGTGKNLTDSNVSAISVLAYDVDGKEIGQSPEDATRVLRASGIAHVVYSSWSNGEKKKFRIVIPIKVPFRIAGDDRDDRVNAYKLTYHWLAERFGIAHDRACCNVSRLFYMPSCPMATPTSGPLAPFSWFFAGRPLDFDVEVQVALESVPKPTKPSTQQSARTGVKKSALQSAELRDAHLQSIRSGVDIHASTLSYALGAANYGWDAEDIESELQAALDAADDGSERIATRRREVAGIVKSAIEKAEASGPRLDIIERHRVAEAQRLAELAAKNAAADPKSFFAEIAAAEGAVDLETVNRWCLIGSMMETPAAHDEVAQRIADKTGRARKVLMSTITAMVKDRARRVKEEKRQATREAAEMSRQQAWGNGDRLALNFNEDGMTHCLNETWQALGALNGEDSDPIIYDHTGGLARARWVGGEDGHREPQIEVLSETALSNEVRRVVRFESQVGSKYYPDQPPPPRLLSDMLAERDPPIELPPLTGVVDRPVFTTGGELVTKPGYNRGAMLIYAPAPGLDVGDIPQTPTPEDVAWAKSMLIDHAIEGFPLFDKSDVRDREREAHIRKDHPEPLASVKIRQLYGRASRANAVAMLLLPSVRPLITGSTPISLITKNMNRAGASTLCDVHSLINTGRKADFTQTPKTEEEWEKRIAAFVDNPPPAVYFDNIGTAIQSAVLASTVTSGRFTGRRLGKSSMIRGATRFQWIANGNNIVLSNELALRCNFISIKPNVVNPEARNDFVHPDLLGWTRQNRGVLLRACLILCQHWIAQGMPRNEALEPLGGFLEWQQVMDGILSSAGIEGFMGNRDEAKGSSVNAELAAVQDLFSAWYAEFKSGDVELGSADKSLEIARGYRNVGNLIKLIEFEELDVPSLDLKKGAHAGRNVLSEFLRDKLDKPIVIAEPAAYKAAQQRQTSAQLATEFGATAGTAAATEEPPAKTITVRLVRVEEVQKRAAVYRLVVTKADDVT